MQNIKPGFIISKIIKLAVVLLFLSITLLVSVAPATRAAGSVSITRTFQPSSADSWLKSGTANGNFGTDTTMDTATVPRHGIVRFDISSIATGSSVSSSILSLFVTTMANGNVSLYRTIGTRRVLVTWDEATVTWNTPGSTAGTHYASSTTSSTDIYGDETGFHNWTVTTDVSNFIAGTQTNYGWRITDEGGTASNNSITYATKEYATTANRPKLAVTFTAPWESYRESGRTNVEDAFTATYPTAYMKGTGFPAGNYNVSYYDNDGDIIRSENNIAVAGDGVLQSYITFSDYQGLDPAIGTWHALVQPASGYGSLPALYSTAVASPDAYGLVANDSFDVASSAVPEIPTVIAGVIVCGACFGIYWWMRRRKSYGVLSSSLSNRVGRT